MFFKDLIQVKQHTSNLVQVDRYLLNKNSIFKAHAIYDYNQGYEDGFLYSIAKKIPHKHLKRFYSISEGVIDGIMYHKNTLENHEKTVTLLQDTENKLFLRIKSIDKNNSVFDFFNNIDIKDLDNITGMLIQFTDLDDINIAVKFKNVLIKILEVFDIAHIQGEWFGKIISLEHMEFPSVATISLVKKEINNNSVVSVTYPLEIDKHFKHKLKFSIPS